MKSLKDLWQTIKHTNIGIMGVLEGEQREKGAEKNIWRSSGEKLPKSDERC